MNREAQNICAADGKVLLDANAVCDVCGKFGAYNFGHRILCQDCYGNSGSCCREFGNDDLWAIPDESKNGFMKRTKQANPSAETTFNPASGELLALVAEQPFFKGMSGRLMEQLADSILEIRFNPGDLIYRQGEPANRFYLILEGKVSIESEVKDRGLIPIRTLGPGDDLGWAWLFPPYYMHFSASALDPVRAIFFYGTRLREKCEENHELGYHLMKRVAEVVVRNLNATQQLLLQCRATELDPPARPNAEEQIK